jgi:hypothetical protein
MEIYLEYSDASRGRQPVIVGIHCLDMRKPLTGERLSESGGIIHLQHLEGYGILEAPHALFQVLDLALLLGQQAVFDALESFRHFLVERLYLLIQGLHILFAGHDALNHRGKVFNGFYFLGHMYSSIAGLAVVSMAGVDAVPIRHSGGRCRSCRGNSVVRGETPAGRGRMADFSRR